MSTVASLRREIEDAKRRLIWQFINDERAKKERAYEKSLAEVVDYVIADHVRHHQIEAAMKDDLAELLGRAVMRLGGASLTEVSKDDLK